MKAATTFSLCRDGQSGDWELRRVSSGAPPLFQFRVKQVFATSHRLTLTRTDFDQDRVNRYQLTCTKINAPNAPRCVGEVLEPIVPFDPNNPTAELRFSFHLTRCNGSTVERYDIIAQQPVDNVYLSIQPPLP